MDTTDRDVTIYEAIACEGRPARAVAQEYGITVAEVELILERVGEEHISGKELRASIAASSYRFEKSEIKFFNRGMEGDGDSTAMMVAVKCNERRMTMLGGNAPIGHAVRMIVDTAQPQKTSTDRIAEVIERLCSEGQVKADEDVAARDQRVGTDNPK